MLIHRSFEFTQIGNVNRSFLELYLIEVWQQRFSELLKDDILEEGEDLSCYQGILSFDNDFAKTRNYIGVIQTEQEQIEIYPKVFKQFDTNYSNTRMFIKHLFFWFDYCRKWKFPFTKNNLDQSLEYDLPELIINIMADRIKDVVTNLPISIYEETEESLTMPRGRISFGRYIANGLSNGNHHIIECDVEPLLYDNKLNRAIKYVTRILYKKAKFSETRQKLNDIIFILDEVEEVPCTSAQLNTIKINSFYLDYLEIIDICRLVLDQQIYSNQLYMQTQWCLLFPMEYIFEDFVTGFIEKHFENKWEVEPQKSNETLTDQGLFQMRHDIYLTSKINPSLKIILDTKYKLRSPEIREKDGKRGIAQSDLYQMTSYAFRRGCKTVLLLYPNYSEEIQPNDCFTITSAFEAKSTINIIAAEVPFWNMSKFDLISEMLYKTLDDLLSSIKIQ